MMVLEEKDQLKVKLKEIFGYTTFRGNQETVIKNILNGKKISEAINVSQKSLRKIIQIGVQYGIPLPSFSASLSYFDAYRSKWLPANLIQAQRDFFGAHTYERLDKEGTFHSEWNAIIQ